MTMPIDRVNYQIAKTNSLLNSCQRTCKECGKTFIVPHDKRDWTYKIRVGESTWYYCCYSHWIKEIRKQEATKAANREAYYERQRQKKNRENKRRRERQNGSTSDVQSAS